MRQIEIKNCSYTYQPGTINSHQALYDINLAVDAGAVSYPHLDVYKSQALALKSDSL